MAKTGSASRITLIPTMGAMAETIHKTKGTYAPYQMLLNVVSRGGVLSRRPRIRAMDMGYSTSFAPSDGQYTESSSNTTYAPRWTIMGDPDGSNAETTSVADDTHVWLRPPGGLVITAANIGRYIDTNTRIHEPSSGAVKRISGLTVGTAGAAGLAAGAAGEFAGAVKAQLGSSLGTSTRGTRVHAIQIISGAASSAAGEHTTTRSIHPVNIVLEGIDCEVIGNTIVALYIGRNIQSSSYTTNTDVYFYHSFHHIGDPRIGNVQAQSVAASTINDNIDSWYTAASYWKKRISPSFGDYLITGHGVGPEVVGASVNAAGDYHDHDIQGSSVLFSGVDVQMFATAKSYRNLDTNGVSSIARADPYGTIYCTHSPKNAFMYTERNSGQSIWYGFANGDDFLLSSEVPAVTAMLGVPEEGLSALRDTMFVRNYDLWFSEPLRPLSLNFTGHNSVHVGSRSPDVVGLADYSNGTAIFTHDTIQFTKGIGAASGTNAATRSILHSGIGADSRWSIKSIGTGVVFLNKKGLWHLSTDGQVNEAVAFRGLFGMSGIDCSRGPYHAQITADVDGPDPGDEFESNSHADNAYDEFEYHPWRNYKIDIARLDRAVAGVWDDLYLCFVSLDGDDIGNDNRLALCWNWKENTFTTWLLPKDMGVRGWAYDGKMNTPYVMTRYGLARFEDCNQGDEIWYNTGPKTSDGSTFRQTGAIYATVPVPAQSGYGYETKIYNVPGMPFILGQSYWLPESGDSYVIPSVIIQHETKHDYDKANESWTRMGPVGGSATYESGDDDYKMKARIWSQKAELIMTEFVSESHAGFMKMNFSNTGIKPLENLADETNFKLWRDRHCMSDSTPSIGTIDSGAKFRLPNSIRRLSRARSGFQATRFVVQFSTAAPNQIFSVSVVPGMAAPSGERG
jgi:hypothetical protein